MKIDKTYIVHLEKLSERKIYLDEAILNKVGFENVEYIISTEQSDKEILENNNYVYKQGLYGNLTNPEICNYVTQYRIWEKIKNSDYENCLIVEDDILFKNNFNEIFQDLLNNVPSDYNICFLSECCNLYPNNPDKLKFVEHSRSRCCIAYLINKKTCQNLTSIKEFHFPVDHQLNFVKNNFNFKYYWSDPTAFNNGSTKQYKSNAERNR